MPAFGYVALFAALILAPTALYLVWAHTAWSWMYVVDPEAVPALAIVPVVIGHAALVLLSWYVGGKLVRAGRRRGVVSSVAVGGGALVVGVGAFAGRLGEYGTFEDFARGTSAGLMDVKLGYVLVVMSLGVGAAAAHVALELVRDSRRVRAR